MMWFTMRLTIYDPATDPPKATQATIEGTDLWVVLDETAARMELAWQTQEGCGLGPIAGALLMALELTCAPSFKQAVTHDTAAERILQAMRNSVAASLFSLGSAPSGGTRGNSSGSSPN